MIPFRSPVPRFFAGGDLFVGANALVALRAMAATRVSVVVSTGAAADADLMSLLEKAIGAPIVELLPQSAGEPDFAGARALSASFHRSRPDWIVALGGGSVIDLARAAWLFYEHPSLETPIAGRRMAIPALRGLSRFAAVPSTAGSGAEVSSAVVMKDAEQAKLPLVSPEFLPDLVIIDPRVTHSVPIAVLQQSLGDILAHFVEGFVSSAKNPIVSQLARALFPSVLRLAKAGIPARDDVIGRTELMLLGLQGGWIQNHRPPGLGHAVAHQLSRIGVSHSVASSLCLPLSIMVNAADAGTRREFDILASDAGVTGGAEALATELALLISRLLAEPPKVAGKIGSLHDEMVRAAVADPLSRTNPIPVTRSMVEQVLAGLP